MRDLLRDAWETVRGVAGVAVRKLSWRESLKIFRDSLLTGIGERVVGIIIFAAVVAMAVLVLAIVRELARAAGGAP